MKQKLTFFFLIAISITAFSQNIEKWREKGYQAKINGKIDSSIYFYEKILETEPDDYDAKLALARLYFEKEEYKKSKNHFKEIYKNDKTDVEALKGIAGIYLMTDRLEKAIQYYKKALEYQPGYVPLHFGLAKAYSWNDQLPEAVEEYKKIISIDSTYSEAWQGIGKMLYWQEKPVTALKYYRKALNLDPFSIEISREYEQILRETKLRLSATAKFLNENEENYNIDAFIQTYGLAKRITDQFEIQFSFALDRSDRKYKDINPADTIRNYDNTMLKLGWITPHNRFDVYTAYSKSDEKLSAYGIDWKMAGNYGHTKYTNKINAGYDYFYYWNKIGHKIISENFSLKYYKINIKINGGYGIVDSAFVDDVAGDRYEKDVNPHYEYGVSLGYTLFSKPKVDLSAGFSYTTYKYKSKYYYSPLGRKLIGPSFSIYHKYHGFYLYGGFSTNVGSEYYYETEGDQVIKYYIDANNWSADFELGYEFKSLSASLSASRFYNDYYSNYNVAFNMNYLF